MEPTTKKISVTFTQGLPNGTEAHFTHDRERWVAHPLRKEKAMRGVTVQLLHILDGINKDMLRWLNAHPEDAARVVMLGKRVAVGQKLLEGLTIDDTTARRS